MKEKVILAYSGGLDTTAIIPWLKENYDYIIAMDRNNLRNIDRIIGSDEYNKVSLLLDFAGRNGQSIADPWYTGDFDITYDDIKQGLDGFLEYLGY